MVSVYTNHLRLEEIGTGEQSGDWGTTTNTNLELIAEAFSYSFTGEAIANSSTDDITVADGASDQARSLYLKLTGGGQACTVTLKPNDLSKVWLVENTTSFTLTMKQGSGATVDIAAGQVKMIATDGQGSSAAVYDLLTDVNLAGTTVATALTVDDVAIDGKVITMTGSTGDTAVMTVGTNGTLTVTTTDTAAAAANITITADGTFEAVGTTITLDSGGDIELEAAAGGDVNIPANIGLTFGDDGEKIEGDGTDLTISGNNINLTAVADVNIPSGVGLTFATAEKIESDGTDLSITVGSGGDINIPADIGVTFGDDGEKIEGDGTDLTISGNNINLTATADVVIPANVGITFGTGEKIEGDSTDLTITSGAKINLTATSDVIIPSGVGLVLDGSGNEKIESDGTDISISVGSGGDINIPANIGVTFGDDGEKIEGDGTDLTISGNNINLSPTSTVTVSGVVDVTDTTDATDATGDTGALRTEGGASIAKKLFVGTDLTVGGDLTISGDDLVMGTNTAGMLLIADGTNFNPTAISSLTEISTAANDDVFIAIDTSGGGLKKITRSAIIAGTGASGDIANVVEDTSPQLGGNLDTNSHNILIDDAHFIGDENGNEQIIFQTTSSAVNEIEITNAASGSGVQIASTGGDTNIDLKLLPKGSGQVVIDGNVGIESGLIDLKNAGAVSKIKFYCESSNAHAQTLQGAPHSEAASNILTLPSTGGNVNLVSTASTATLTNKTFGDNTSFGDNNITNVGDIALDSISADGTDINVAVSDNSATAFTIKQGSDAYLIIDTANSSESVSIGTGISGTAITIGHTTSETTVADNLTVTGDLTVSGTTTTVNSTTVNLNDHNIVLDSGNSTSAVINGAGITIEGGSGDDATFTYNTTGPKFELKLGSAHEDLQVAGLIATTGVFSGILKSDDTTDATSTTDGSLQTDGGLSVAKDAVLGNDVKLLSDAAVLSFGANSEVTLTHVHDDGLLLNADNQLQFRDSAINIRSDADGDLDINADDEIELNSTLIDINGNVKISGTLAQADTVTMATNKKIQFRDTGLHISSTADGQLDLVADTEIQIAATTIDINGAVEISGATTQTGISTSAAKDVFNAGMSVKNGSTSAGFVEFFEDSDNGTNKVTLIGPASTSDITLTLPSSAGTLALTTDGASKGFAIAMAIVFG